MSIGNIQFDILQGNLEINMGSIIENIIAQELTSNGFKLRYFDGKTTYFPLYMIQFLQQDSLPGSLVVNVDLP